MPLNWINTPGALHLSWPLTSLLTLGLCAAGLFLYKTYRSEDPEGYFRKNATMFFLVTMGVLLLLCLSWLTMGDFFSLLQSEKFKWEQSKLYTGLGDGLVILSLDNIFGRSLMSGGILVLLLVFILQVSLIIALNVRYLCAKERFWSFVTSIYTFLAIQSFLLCFILGCYVVFDITQLLDLTQTIVVDHKLEAPYSDTYYK